MPAANRCYIGVLEHTFFECEVIKGPPKILKWWPSKHHLLMTKTGQEIFTKILAIPGVEEQIKNSEERKRFLQRQNITDRKPYAVIKSTPDFQMEIDAHERGNRYDVAKIVILKLDTQKVKFFWKAEVAPNKFNEVDEDEEEGEDEEGEEEYLVLKLNYRKYWDLEREDTTTRTFKPSIHTLDRGQYAKLLNHRGVRNLRAQRIITGSLLAEFPFGEQYKIARIVVSNGRKRQVRIEWEVVERKYYEM